MFRASSVPCCIFNALLIVNQFNVCFGTFKWIDYLKDMKSTVILCLMTKTQGFVRSSVRKDISNEIFLIMYWMETIFTHVSAHVGVEGNEQVELELRVQTCGFYRAKLRLYHPCGHIYSMSVWQEHWNDRETGRHMYNIKKNMSGQGERWAGREGREVSSQNRSHGSQLHIVQDRRLENPHMQTDEHALKHWGVYTSQRYHFVQSLRNANTAGCIQYIVKSLNFWENVAN